MYRVIFHLNEKEKFKQVYNNILNLISDFEERKWELEIELLVNAQPVECFKINNKEFKSEVEELIDKEVKISLCNNTLEKLDCNIEEFPKKVKVVTSGIGELVEKQSKGWLYIKP